jgi:CubicO group peptidase (beta-lactamase class C family)
MNRFESILKEKIELGTEGALNLITPGLKLRAYERGRLKGELKLGKVYKFYDLASLTKILFTVPVIMRLVEQGKIKPSRPMIDYLPWFPSKSVTVKDVLSHSGGLPWWTPFYSKLSGPIGPVYRWRQLEVHLRKVKTDPKGQAVYSDLDFLMLGMMIENQLGLPLEAIWDDFKKTLKIPRLSLHFNKGNEPRYLRKFYAPTEKCSWRGKTLQGEVHDENSWSLGGVAPHAGLFGTIEDVSQWGLLLRKSFLDTKGSKLISQKTLRRFARRAIPKSKGDWAMGFMLPSKGKASCGKYFSSQSFGHTGFTGTSLWFDPRRDLLVVILSNRVHPTRENSRFVGLRPQLHDWIVESLEEIS